MMNPSTADEIENDPTIERCQRRVRAWEKHGIKLGGIEVVNVLAWRETDSRMLPKRIAEGIDLIGEKNDRHILEAVKDAAIVVCAWGVPGHKLLNRGPAVLELLRSAGKQPHAFAYNADGSPIHPLYIGYDVMPKPMEA